MEIIDLEAIRRLEQLNVPGSPRSEDIVNQLIGIFIGKSSERGRELREAVEKMDFEAVFAAAHAFRSGSVNLGLSALSSLCERIESAARAQDPAEIRRLQPEFSRSWSESVAALERLREERLK